MNKNTPKISLIKSTFYNEKIIKEKLCKFILSAQKLSMGSQCAKFEQKFSRYQRRKYSVLFNSGSSANLALIQALMNLELIKKNDPVGFSALTWATNVMPLLQLNLKSVPIDVNPHTLNVDSENLLKVLKKNKIKVLFITNLLGFCSDLNKILEICKNNNIILLEDNCESLGSELNNKKLGNFGLASTFSFFVGHHLPTIEGGMVCTDNQSLCEMLKMVRAHGWSRDLSHKTKAKLRKENNIDSFYNLYTFYNLGYNLRPTEITGFLGLAQLKYIERIHKSRNENFLQFYYYASLNQDFQKLNFQHMSFVSNFAYPLICKNKGKFLQYKKRFEDKGVEIRPIVAGSILEQPFFKKYRENIKNQYLCNNAKYIHENGFYFPNNPELSKNEIKIICNLLKP